MPSSFVARLLSEPAVREHKNVYGKGITPHFTAQNEVAFIVFSDDYTREMAESWLTEHDYSGFTFEEVEQEVKQTHRSLAFGISDISGRMERNGHALTIKGVRLLAEGTWTDSMQKTPWRVKSDVLERFASNWNDDTVWNRHAGGQHRAVTDKIGKVQNVRYKSGAVLGDVALHGLTQNSRDAAALVEAGEINFVSVETLGSDKWNVGTKEFEAQDITFTGLALVNRGACKVCKLRENSEPDPAPVTDPAPEEEPEKIEEPHMTPEEIAALKADITKELSGVYDGKIKELSDELAAAKTENANLTKKVKELAEAEAEIKTRTDSRELAAPGGYHVVVDSNGEVYAMES